MNLTDEQLREIVACGKRASCTGCIHEDNPNCHINPTTEMPFEMAAELLSSRATIRELEGKLHAMNEYHAEMMEQWVDDNNRLTAENAELREKQTRMGEVVDEILHKVSHTTGRLHVSQDLYFKVKRLACELASGEPDAADRLMQARVSAGRGDGNTNEQSESHSDL